jgi:chorismate synthase
VKKGLASVNVKSKKCVRTVYERSDVCAVPAASLIAESVISIEVLNAVLETTGGAEMGLIKMNYENYLKHVKKY